MIPKYTECQLSKLVEDELERIDLSFTEVSSAFNVDSAILKEVLSGEVKFKVEHYEAISEVTGLSINHLLAAKEIEYPDCESKFKGEINKIADFFAEVNLLKRMNC